MSSTLTAPASKAERFRHLHRWNLSPADDEDSVDAAEVAETADPAEHDEAVEDA